MYVLITFPAKTLLYVYQLQTVAKSHYVDAFTNNHMHCQDLIQHPKPIYQDIRMSIEELSFIIMHYIVHFNPKLLIVSLKNNGC